MRRFFRFSDLDFVLRDVQVASVQFVQYTPAHFSPTENS